MEKGHTAIIMMLHKMLVANIDYDDRGLFILLYVDLRCLIQDSTIS